MMTDDATLLREYAGRNSEEAFTALVSRHVNLVYSVALRRVRDPHLPEEITQAVFIILARKAKSLGPKTILSGWLCRTARNVSANALTMQRRRQRREQEAYMQSTLNEPEPDAWQQIAPLLDDALARLGQKDHDALVLRFFENKSLGEVGLAIGASEDTARMRVNRALEKLRKFFFKRGVCSTAETIAGTISANSIQAAPAALAKTVTAIALAKGAAASISTLTLIKGALKIMAWTKAKTAIVTGAAILLASTATTVVVKEMKNNRPPPKLETRSFKVDTRIFLFNLREAMNPSPSASATNIAAIAADFFASKGINFQPPKSIAFNDQLGLLFTKATSSELNAVEKIVQQLNTAPAQFHIKAYFIQVPESDVASILKVGTVVDTKENNTVEIMSDTQTQSLLRKLRTDGATTLSEPEVVTTSGRQVQMRSGNSSVDIGSGNAIADIVPTVLADGYTVKMKVIVSGPETLSAQANILDGQAVVLAPNNSGDGKTRLLVIVTTNIVDPAGNLVHTKNKLPFNPSAIPPQD
jgi:RNA polymerase sigma factor (sigma-70 family)